MLEHLKARGMNCSLYPFMGMDDEVACFPMYDFSGRMTGFHQYRPDGEKKNPNHPKLGRYFTYIASGKLGVFGLESLKFSKEIYLVGGLFKATTLHRLGYASLHVSGASYKHLKPQLALLNRPFLAIGDQDSEGAQFVARYGGWQSLGDVDELTDKDVIEMVEYHTQIARNSLRN